MLFEQRLEELLKDKTYVYCCTPKLVQWLFKMLAKAESFAFDIETDHPTRGKPRREIRTCIVGISFSWAAEIGAFLPVYNSWDEPFWKIPAVHARVIAKLKQAMESDVPKIAQNGKFDVKELFRDLGIQPKAFVFDTMLAHHLIDEEGYFTCRHGLEAMEGHYFGEEAAGFKRLKDDALNYYDPALGRYSLLPRDLLSAYGCSDSDFTFRLAKLFGSQLEEQGLTSVFDRIVMPLQHVLMISELNGVLIDEAKVEELDKFYTKRRQELREQIWEQAGEQFDVGSPEVLSGILFTKLGLPKGKMGQNFPSTDKHVLEKLKGKHPIIEHIIEYRSCSKCHDSYVIGVKNRLQAGRIHTTYWQLTVTGRLSSEDPNLQQLPRPENGGELIKAMFISDPGYSFIFADYSQIEMRLTAHVSGEPTWKESFLRGENFHSSMAKKVFDLPCPVEDVERLHSAKYTEAKTINFGILYQRGAKALSEALGITLKAAQKLIDDYYEKCPTLSAWIKDIIAEATNTGYVLNIFGRRRRLPKLTLWTPDVSYVKGAPSCFGKERSGAPSFGGPLSFLKPEDVKHYTNVEFSKVLESNPKYAKCSQCRYLASCVWSVEKRYRRSLRSHAERQAVNYVIQSSAGDLTNYAYVKLYEEFKREGFDFFPSLQVHDELVIQVKDDQVDRAKARMEEIMTTCVKLDVPLEVDIDVVKRWSDLYLKEEAA